MTVETVDCEAAVGISLTVPLTTECPIKDEWDTYDVTVRWRPAGETFEKWGLRDAVADFTGAEITQEELCASIYQDLRPAAVTDLSVTVRDTKHMDMVVRAQ